MLQGALYLSGIEAKEPDFAPLHWPSLDGVFPLITLDEEAPCLGRDSAVSSWSHGGSGQHTVTTTTADEGVGIFFSE